MAEDKRLEQPLSAAEIEELRELEAKATGGRWEFEAHGPDGHMALYSERDHRFHGLRLFNVYDGDTKCADNIALVAAMRNALPRILAMLQPPADAAVREAVEKLEMVRAVAEDVNVWLKATGREGTAHQRELDAALAECGEGA